jgi:nucleoside-diphosphate-sugar epimerase
MTFREDKRGEPFKTNVDGTRHLLEFCRQTGIRQLHHVSTAYICGLRQGKILETDVDAGQTLGNVYEQSKLAAEKLVRAATFLDQVTFYRPASVVGDSRSGYVTSFHGFYLPLQLAHTMAGRVPVRQMDERFFAKLGLRGDEGKNLVPVDWLSAAIVELVTHPEHHGRTYHLASPEPVPVVEIQKVVADAIERYYPKPLATSIAESELQALEALFYEYMTIYQSHWRDDPKFDLTNTLSALPHLPCPKLTYDVLMTVARYPIERNFVAPRHEPPEPQCEVGRKLAAFSAAESPAAGEPLRLQVTGPGGGQWQLHVVDERIAAVEPGLPLAPTPGFYLSAATFAALESKQLSIDESINSGRLVIQGPSQRQDELKRAFEQILSSHATNGSTQHALPA